MAFGSARTDVHTFRLLQRRTRRFWHNFGLHHMDLWTNCSELLWYKYRKSHSRLTATDGSWQNVACIFQSYCENAASKIPTHACILILWPFVYSLPLLYSSIFIIFLNFDIFCSSNRFMRIQIDIFGNSLP